MPPPPWRSWRLATPALLCGAGRDVTSHTKLTLTADLDSYENLFQLQVYEGSGQATAHLAAEYAPSTSTGIFRTYIVVGFDGHFTPRTAVGNMVGLSQTGNMKWRVVPPGPHGGLMECAGIEYQMDQCVFGTATTLGYVLWTDSTGQLLTAAAPALAVQIRDAIEVSG